MTTDPGRDLQRTGPRTGQSRSALRSVRRPMRVRRPQDHNGPRIDALVSSLELLVIRLRTVFGTAITAELALRGQGAERDVEIADCLRGGVAGPLADQIECLEALAACVANIGGESSGPGGRTKPRTIARGVQRAEKRRRSH